MVIKIKDENGIYRFYKANSTKKTEPSIKIVDSANNEYYISLHPKKNTTSNFYDSTSGITTPGSGSILQTCEACYDICNHHYYNCKKCVSSCQSCDWCQSCNRGCQRCDGCDGYCDSSCYHCDSGCQSGHTSGTTCSCYGGSYSSSSGDNGCREGFCSGCHGHTSACTSGHCSSCNGTNRCSDCNSCNGSCVSGQGCYNRSYCCDVCTYCQSCNECETCNTVCYSLNSNKSNPNWNSCNLCQTATNS